MNLVFSTGRGCQVHGEDRMQWNKINLEGPLKTGDIIGCGWIKEETPEIKNVVYFTLNGVRIEQQFKDTPTDMYPFVHVQKKVSYMRTCIHVCTHTHIDVHCRHVHVHVHMYTHTHRCTL